MLGNVFKTCYYFYKEVSKLEIYNEFCLLHKNISWYILIPRS
ncbi:hypothetical protein TPHV1_20048 [Treponema phagedenis]|uniref:Uncharacterized protein n=1 Tax=Treponema phagedenis TaxID=162 RepID=A0A0B7GY26_TREPH|nr:hypothetical protein TPHV1_20048 [Treponema phagedenis]